LILELSLDGLYFVGAELRTKLDIDTTETGNGDGNGNENGINVFYIKPKQY